MEIEHILLSRRHPCDHTVGNRIARPLIGSRQLCDLITDRTDSYRVIYGNTRAINIAEIDPQGSAEEPWEEQSIGNILKKIKTGDEQALKEAVKESVTQLSERGASLQKYQIFITELIAEIFRFGTLNGLNLDEISSASGDSI